MKYRMKDKRARNDKIMQYRRDGYTIRAIAGKFHISAAMVGKIVKRESGRGEA